jgi:peptidoglycan/xylan/chitin deacetylase (PgdA/CDA1 family)
MDPTHLQRVRHWAAEDGEGLTPNAHAAAATALAAAENGVSAEDRSAALKWARTARRRGATAAERSAARSIVALLDDLPTPRARERPIESAEVSTAHEEQPVTPNERVEARPRRSRASAATIRRRRIVALAGAGAVALLVAGVAGARSVFAPSLEATGPARSTHVDAAGLAKLEFTATGASKVRWKLDGSDVSARATHEGSTQTLRLGALPDGEHRVEVKRGGGFLGAETTRSWSFTVDTAPPSIELDGPAAAKPRQPLFLEGTVEPGARLLIAGHAADVDDGRFAARISPPLPRRLLLEAVDLAGNSATRRVAVEIIPRRPAEPVRAVHVTSYGWADVDLRRGVMKLIDEKRINAIEIDLKDESGEVGFDASVPLGGQIGAVTHVYDLDDVVSKMHARGIRVIGRLVCFRDPVLASAAWKHGQRNRVVQTPDGGQYAGYGGFTNFADPAVRKYNIDIAVAAARAGVDDVLYDYVRRPDGPRQSMVFPGLRGTPEHAIVEFIRETRLALEPYGTFLGLSVFGVAATRPLEVAQDVPAMARESDYIAPMVYPSHWGPGEYNVANPNSQPYEIVLRSLRDFRRQTRGTGARVVPWLQDFTLGISYGEAEVRAQIEAARRNGIDEFLLWDPTVTYTSEALDPNAEATMRGLAHPHEGEPIPAHTPKARPKARETAHPKAVAGRLPNELGEVPVLMHHEIRDDRVGDYDQTPAEFRTELERLWSQGYWPVRAADLALGRLGSVPAGKTPVVLTFDDSTQFQFSYDERGNVKPDTAIGILLEFQREHPAFPLAGTFYVNREPFAGVARGKEMLRWLVDHGFELGNHTKDHEPFNQLSGPSEVQKELVLGNEVIEGAVSGYRVRTMALPLGVPPKPASLAVRGRWTGRTYTFSGVMLIGAGPAPSPFDKEFDRAGIPRIRSGHLPWNGEADFGAWYWLRALKQSPERRYVSDGDPATIAFPRALEKNLRPAFSSRARAY